MTTEEHIKAEALKYAEDHLADFVETIANGDSAIAPIPISFFMAIV